MGAGGILRINSTSFITYKVEHRPNVELNRRNVDSFFSTESYSVEYTFIVVVILEEANKI